jgi:hypothetical protein
VPPPNTVCYHAPEQDPVEVVEGVGWVIDEGGEEEDEDAPGVFSAEGVPEAQGGVRRGWGC